MLRKKKTNVRYLENEKRLFRENIQVGKVRKAEFDLVYQPSRRWKVAPIQQRLSKERTSLIFLLILLLQGLHSILSACHLSQSVTTASYLFTEYFMRYLNIALFRTKTVHAANWH